MIEEPYRWLEAIQNRREYIRDQMRGGTPVFALSRPEGILLLGVGTGQSKVFEIYDRHGYCALGNPVDIEKLRQTAIEAAHTEGFQRAPDDVLLRRLVNFALSPLLKDQFEKIFSPPLIVDCLFAEVGSSRSDDVVVHLQYDGSPDYASGGIGVAFTDEQLSTEAVSWLLDHVEDDRNIDWVVSDCLSVWQQLVDKKPLDELKVSRKKIMQIPGKIIEAGLLDRVKSGNVKYRKLDV